MQTFSQFLTENPYNQFGTLPKRFEDGNVTSNKSIIRLYDFLFSHTFGNHLISFYKHKNANAIFGFTKIHNPQSPEHENKVVFNLTFYDQPTLRHTIPHSAQVESAIVADGYEGLGIASYVYLRLALAGLTIISDSTQFDDGKHLWLKMARESLNSGYKITIFNDVMNKYLTDQNGNIIQYDSTNIDDCEIWSTNRDYSKMDILLVLST